MSPADDCDTRPADDGTRFDSAIALLAGLGVLVLVAGGAAVFFLVMNEATALVSVTCTIQVDADGRPVARYTRDQVRALVLGKTRAEVTAILANQKHTVQPGPPEVWRFGGLTVDPETGRPDFGTVVTFDGDTATAVGFDTGPVRQVPGFDLRQ